MRRARQLIETGVPCVRVNMFETVFHRTTWDSHGTRPFSTIGDYKDTVGPAFDAAYSSLLEDLHNRGLLKTTLVIAMGEFGRTPRINPSGGRDHWTKCYTVLMAGGGIQGGQIYGSSDSTGAEPKDNPVSVAQILAATLHNDPFEIYAELATTAAAFPAEHHAAMADALAMSDSEAVREAALAHKYKSETTAAYQRGQKLEKRRKLMDDWASFLAASNVVPLRTIG